MWHGCFLLGQVALLAVLSGCIIIVTATVADPVAGAWEPLGVARGVGVDEEARLLAAVAEGAEGVVAVAAPAAVPVALPPPAAAARPARRGPRAGHRSPGSRRRWRI